MFWVIFELAKSFLSSVLDSRIGQIVIAFSVAWFWSSYNTENKWKDAIAKERAQIESLYQAELQRQKAESAEIAANASKRDAENAEIVAGMKSTIENYMNKLKEQPHVVTKNVPNNDCSIDRGFSSVVHELDSSRTRKTRASSGAGKLR